MTPLAIRRVGLPVAPFELIAGRAAIDQVFQRVTSALRTGLKMIHRQLGTDIDFSYAAVPASKRITGAQCLSVGCPHYLAAPIPLGLRIAVICAFILSRSETDKAKIRSSRRANRSLRRTRD